MAGGRPFTAPWEHFKIVNGTRHVKYKSAHCRYGNQLLTKLQPSRHLKKHITTCQRMPVDICEAYAGEDLLSKRLKNGKAAVPQPAGCEDARSRDMDNILLTPEDKKRFLMKTVMVFYTNCWAFRLVEDPDVRTILAGSCREEFLPTRQQLADDLLVETSGLEKAELVEFLLSQGYVALVTDGWSNSRRERFINFILLGPNMRLLLLTCRVTGEDTKSGPYMADMIAEVIAEVEAVIGVGKVVAVTLTMRAL